MSEQTLCYRKGNTIIRQVGFEIANDYTFSDDDYEVGIVCALSTSEWLARGYKQIDESELREEVEKRGYEYINESELQEEVEKRGFEYEE